jgi:hypothetical protein
MARKRYSDEDCLKILRQVEVELAAGADVATACRSEGISPARLISPADGIYSVEIENGT